MSKEMDSSLELPEGEHLDFSPVRPCVELLSYRTVGEFVVLKPFFFFNGNTLQQQQETNTARFLKTCLEKHQAKSINKMCDNWKLTLNKQIKK